jgi:hypothetical protein
MHRLKWLISLLLTGTAAYAHLVDAQKGTLSLDADRAYLVMSIPISGLQGFDDNGDGLLSTDEFKTHLQAIESQIQNGIELSDSKRIIPISNLVVQLSLSSDKPEPERQLLAIGQYALQGMGTDLRFKVQIFGLRADEKRQYITVTRGAETQLLTLTSEFNQRDIFPSYYKVFQDQIQLGIQHILEGTDHLLFLLVVLAAEKNLLAILSVLTAFTMGHALTLIICQWLAWSAPSVVVEPAIAATIVGIALMDLYLSKEKKQHSMTQRLMVVFACATVHGLGLADAFTDLGLTGGGKMVSLAGFNVGIELGQLVVAFMAVFLFQILSKYLGTQSVNRMKNYFHIFAVLLGGWWFADRILAA